MAGRGGQDGWVLKQLLGYRQATEVWSTYCAATEGATASFATIERAGGVLLFADYTLHALEPHTWPGRTAPTGLAAAFHARTYLSRWPRYAAPVVFARLRALVLRAVAQQLTGPAPEGTPRSSPTRR